MSDTARDRLAAAAITLAVTFVYSPVAGFLFVVLDDKAFVSENPVVAGGLSAENVRRAVTEAQAASSRRDRALYHGRRSLSLARLTDDDAQARAATAWLTAFEGR